MPLNGITLCKTITDPNYQDHNSNQINFLYKVSYLETFWTCSVTASLIRLNVIPLGGIDFILIDYLAEFVGFFKRKQRLQTVWTAPKLNFLCKCDCQQNSKKWMCTITHDHWHLSWVGVLSNFILSKIFRTNSFQYLLMVWLEQLLQLSF